MRTRDVTVAEDMLEDPGKGIEVALPGDTIMKRHICTRASNKREIVVLVVGDSEFVGYSIGLDDHSLQILELPSGEVSSISRQYIVAVSDGRLFKELSPEEKDAVDRRTASFRKNSQEWLTANWPDVYERREDNGHYQNRQRYNRRPPSRPNVYGRFAAAGDEEGRVSSDADSQVRD